MQCFSISRSNVLGTPNVSEARHGCFLQVFPMFSNTLERIQHSDVVGTLVDMFT